MAAAIPISRDKIRLDITLSELYRVSRMPAPPKAVMDPASTTGLKKSTPGISKAPSSKPSIKSPSTRLTIAKTAPPIRHPQ
ncbi:hypothetical protein D3C74_484620 [compost metagenome]